jgi:hypothetical protein
MQSFTLPNDAPALTSLQGMPYKFVASADSEPFEAAPEYVRAARSILNFWGQHFFGEEYEQANEVLVLGYMPDGAINVSHLAAVEFYLLITIVS